MAGKRATGSARFGYLGVPGGFLQVAGNFSAAGDSDRRVRIVEITLVNLEFNRHRLSTPLASPVVSCAVVIAPLVFARHPRTDQG